jgi:Putative peptidoglycan binding domain
VHAAAVPGTLVEIRPEFRDDLFFVVRDEIVVLDHSRRIVALIPTGVSHASGNASAGAGLSTEEIRRVQLVLIERGFLNGHADGVLGPRTREALIAFQRHEGLQVSREIDTQTIAALGLSEEFGKKGRAAAAPGGQPSTVGAGGDRTQSNGQGDKNQNREQNQKQTHRENQNRRAGQQGNKDASPASTTGQGDGRSPADRDRTGQGSNHSGSNHSGSNHSGAQPATAGQGGNVDHVPAPRAGAGKGKAASPSQNNSGGAHSPGPPK